MDNHNIEELQDALDDLGDEIKLKLLRSGANAGAQVFRDEARVRAPRWRPGKQGGIGATTRTKYPVKPGQLADSIYRAYNKDKSIEGEVAVYSVSWNHAKAPHGYWMENGNSRHPAHPFIRPAWEAKKRAGVEAALERMVTRWEEIKK